MHQPYSNPIAPPDKEQARRSGLSNDDFRQLMMTPRATGTTSSEESKPVQTKQKSKPHPPKEFIKPKRSANSEWLAELRREDEEREAEWAKNYRDRAKERREGANPDYPSINDIQPATSGYRAVAPNADPSRVAEQRKQVIANSKYLGGDMEHTHLVKGLDYALLQKVRSELSVKEREKKELKLLEKKREREREEKEKRQAILSDEVTFKSKMAKNVYSALFNSNPPERNDFFLPGRMAYVFELDDDYADTDIPTTLIRSKADCPSLETQTTLTTNDIVINKLTQILSYLRQGSKTSKKSKKKEKEETVSMEIPTPNKIDKVPETSKKPKIPEESIFPDVGEYMFTPNESLHSSKKDHSMQYFDSKSTDVETDKDIRKTTAEFVKAVGKKYANTIIPDSDEGELPTGWSKGETSKKSNDTTTIGTVQTVTPAQLKKKNNAGFGGFSTEDHYAECYPGGLEEMDATVNSDDEADFMKMDLGNRKGPVKRWDFDNDEDYGNYQSSREALPKAAFQYGVKMNDGRKTRRQGVKNEKAKLNREWQQISQILQKRKAQKLESVSKRLKSE